MLKLMALVSHGVFVEFDLRMILWYELAQSLWRWAPGHLVPRRGFQACVLCMGLRAPEFWTHRTKFYFFCDRIVREKAWHSRKRVAQAT